MLLALWLDPGASMSGIGDRLALHRQSVSHALLRLEARGFVVKESDPADRRARRLRLTRGGVRAATRFVEQARPRLDDVAGEPETPKD